MERAALIGARLVDPESAEAPRAGTLLVEGERIAARLEPDATVGREWRRVDCSGAFVAPGFLDVHFHGELYQAPLARFGEALARASAEMAAAGTTAFLATTVSWSHDEGLARVGELARLASASRRAAGDSDAEASALCLGLHLEGPWLSPELAGAHEADRLRPFRRERDRELLDRAGDALRMVTLAPELAGAGELLAELARRGVVAALGHSRASAAEIDAGVGGGIRHATHLFNAMGPVHHRAPGVAGHVLADDRLTADLICDGHHVHPDVVKIAARALGERLLLITDRVDLAPGVGSVDPSLPGAPVRLADGTLAGSQLGQDLAVRNAMAFAGLSLVEAVAAATLRPARLLGLERERGTLRPGARADFAVLDAGAHVRATWIGGRPLRSGAATRPARTGAAGGDRR